MAQLYLEKAFDFLEQNKWDKAEALLNDAVDYFPGVSDSSLLKALLLERDGRRYDALTELEQAYEFNNWLLPESRETSDYLYLEMTFITGQYKRFLDYLPETSPFLQNQEEMIIRKIWIKYRKGDEEQVLHEAFSAMKRFPENPYLMIIVFDSLFETDGVNLDLSLFHDTKILEEIVLDLWIREGRDYSKWVKDYVLLFPEGTYVDFLISLSNREFPPNEAFETFISDNYDRYQLVRLLVEDFETDQSDAISSFETLSYKRDTDGDLFEDEWFLLENGKLREKLIDHNQDGVIDLRLLYDHKEIPHSAENTYLSLEYSEYPVVSSIYLNDGFDQRHFILDSSRLEAEIGELMLWTTRKEIPVFDIFDAALSIEEVNLVDGRIVSRTFMDMGVPVFYSEDCDRNGIFDYQLIFNNYKIEAGRRDLDEDGHFELYEYYADGFFRGFALDSNQDRKADYWKQYSPLVLEFWDYNRDFFVDRRSRVLNDTVKLELGIPSELELSAEEILQWDMSNQTDWFIR